MSASLPVSTGDFSIATTELLTVLGSSTTTVYEKWLHIVCNIWNDLVGYCKNASGVATFLHVLQCIFEKFISYSQVDVCQLQLRVLELFISYHPTVLTIVEHHKAFHTSSNVIYLI